MAKNEAAGYFWFMLSGLIGTALFKLFNDAIFAACTLERGCATASWFISYMASIVWQHWLHQRLVFGVPAQQTWREYAISLFWTYVSYSASFVLSTVLNWVLVENLNFGEQAAFVLTLVSTGPINYIALKATAFSDQKKSVA
eukprot:m.242787 g.242787  ORF g.242787 m.242787 type:complete len:142 (-) comp14100_c0_seq1:1324-1749(-)